MTCEEFEELSGAYVLDAITTEERFAADAHLVQCTKCTALVRELRAVVDFLPLAIPQVEPATSLEARVMSAIQQESAGKANITGLPTQRTAAVYPSHPPRPLSQPRRRPRQRWTPRILVAAAALMFVLLGAMSVWNVSLHNQVASLQGQLTHISTPTSQPSQQNGQAYALKGTSFAQGASGQLVYFPQRNVTVLIMNGLPRLKGSHVYQGWLLNMNGQKITSVTSIGLLNVQDGSASIAFPGNVAGYNSAAVSLEPGPTATPKAPKGKVLAIGSLKSTY